jgi:hypothetical protein
MNEELDVVQKEAVVIQFQGTIPEFARKDGGTPQKIFRVAGLRVESWTRNLPNMKECQIPDHDVQW